MPALPLIWKDIQIQNQKLWDTMQIKPERKAECEKRFLQLIANRSKYLEVANIIKMPWYVIACIHSMEAGGNFSKHLHNGDSLAKRTVHVPARRPIADPAAGKDKDGNWLPYTWKESALDALRLKGCDKITDWSIPRILYLMEGYNGYGYRQYHPNVNTPYLWSFTNHYVKGKYVADGKWDANAVSLQVGAACLLKLLIEADQKIVAKEKEQAEKAKEQKP